MGEMLDRVASIVSELELELAVGSGVIEEEERHRWHGWERQSANLRLL